MDIFSHQPKPNDTVLGGSSQKERQLDLFSASDIGAGTAGDAHSADNNGGGSTQSAVSSSDILSTSCQTCFQKFTQSEMGKDGRYCQGCETFLWDEWQVMFDRGVKIKPGWVPRLNGDKPHNGRRKNHKPNGHATPVDKLPIKKIKAMATKGMTSKRIAAELIKKGYEINYRTIAKMVKGSGRNVRTGQRSKAKRLSTASKA